MTFRRARVFAASLAALALLGACGGDGSDTSDDDVDAGATEAAEPVQPETITFTVGKDAIDFPASLESEPVVVTMDNQSGEKSLFVGFGKLNEGVTAEDIEKTLSEKGGGEKVLGQITVAGEVDTRGTDTEPTILFPVGDYVALAPDNPKIAPTYFSVTAASGAPVAEPEAITTIETGDFYFKAEEGIPSSGGIFAITNAGVQSHMVAVTSGRKDVGFSIAPAPGGKIWVDFPKIKPGKYSLMCFFPDPKSGKEHFKLGMQLDVTVE
jgi:hypothetical protein